MGQAPKKLIEIELTGGSDTVYTVPASTTTIVGYISLTNKSASPVTVDVLMGTPTSEVYVRKAVLIEADETKEFYGPAVLEAADNIIMIASGASAIDAFGSGFEHT